ncbi:Salicylate hydroxylase [compost metagenome]
MSFGPNAVRAIAGLGLGEAYLQVADRTPEPWQDVWFEWRRGSDAGYLGASIAPGVGQSSVHRADFLDALVTHLPEGIAQFSKRATQVEQQGDEVRVLFTDGTDYRCDLLIGADGIKSALRSHVLEGLGVAPQAPRFTGTRAYRGMVDSLRLREAYRAHGIDEHLVDVPQMYLGLDGHILTFPVKHGRIINVVAFISDRSQPDPTWPADAPWVREASQREMLDTFAGWGDAARVLLECIPAPTHWVLHELAELPGYVHGRVALIGDRPQPAGADLARGCPLGERDEPARDARRLHRLGRRRARPAGVHPSANSLGTARLGGAARLRARSGRPDRRRRPRHAAAPGRRCRPGARGRLLPRPSAG